MSQSFRLNDVGLINRDKKLSFKFNGVTYYGYVNGWFTNY